MNDNALLLTRNYPFGFISKYSQCTIIALTIGKGVINQSIALNFACKIYISNNINYQTSNQIYIHLIKDIYISSKKSSIFAV